MKLNVFIYSLIGLIILSTLFSCNDKKENMKTLDLMSYGVPLKVKAPEGTVVKTEDMGIAKDITLKKDDDYFIQILSSNAETNNISEIKQKRLDEVKQSPYFSKIIFDEDKGFIFEKKMNDSIYNYDFRYIKIQGDKLFSFQTGLFGLFTKDQVEKMYNSIK